METDAIWNISSTKLSESEISLLNKGLTFCPITSKPKKEQLLDNLYFFVESWNWMDILIAATPPLTKYNKKKDVMLTPNFQIVTSTQTMKHL